MSDTPDTLNDSNPNDPHNSPHTTPHNPPKPIRLNSSRSKESWSTFGYSSVLALDTNHDVQFLNLVEIYDKHACFAALVAQSILNHVKIYATSTDQFLEVQYSGYTKKLTVSLDGSTLIDMDIIPPIIPPADNDPSTNLSK
jgi:hypothetical protein